jgi:ATP-binding cassette subfamily B protein RaxB
MRISSRSPALSGNSFWPEVPMTPEALEIQGSAAGQVTRLLQRLGVETTAADEAAVLGPCPSAEQIALRFAAYGLPARPFRPHKEDLRHIRLPSLALSDLGEAFLVSRSRHGRLQFQRADGSKAEIEAGRAALTFIEIAPALPHGCRFLPRLAKALRGEMRAIVQLGALCGVVQLAALAPPLLTRMITDRLLPDGASDLLLVVCAALLLLQFHRAALDACRAGVARVLDALLESTVLRGSFADLLEKPFAALRNRNVGELLQPLTSAEAVRGLAVGLATTALVDCAVILSTLIALAGMVPAVALSMLAGGTATVAASTVLTRRHAVLQRAEIDATERQNGYLHELIVGAPTISVCGAASTVFDGWLRRFVSQEVAILRRYVLALWLDLLFDGAHQAARLAALLWAAALCLQGHMSAGTLLASTMLADSLMRGLISFGVSALVISSAGIHLDRVDGALGSKPRQKPKALSTEAYAGLAIDIDGVWFRYGDDRPWVLADHKLKIRQGSVLRMQGGSGSGKTTLLRVLAGIEEPQRGRIQILGRAPAEARALIYYLPQQMHLFEGTIRQNLELLSGASYAAIRQVAARSGLQDWIDMLPMGYDTPLPPGAGNVSGGQRQLIALTAAVASGRPLLLLDESLANIDSETQARLWERDLFRGKTTILVYHAGALPHGAASVDIGAW